MDTINVGNRIVNSYIYKTSNGYIAVDTGYENGFTAFLKNLQKNGLEASDISFVFLTHAHDDHAGFLNELLRYSKDTKVIIHPKSLDGLLRGQNSFNGGCTSSLALVFCHLMKLLGKGEHRFPPFDELLKGRLLVLSKENRPELEQILGGTIIETPGHTCDSISLLLNDGTLFCGDAAMNGFPSLHKITIWAEHKKTYIATWKKIINLKPSIILPGHGKEFHYQGLSPNILFAEKMRLRPLPQTRPSAIKKGLS